MKKKVTPYWYLALVLLYALGGVWLSFFILGSGESPPYLNRFILTTELIWLGFSVAMLYVFSRKKYERIARVFPIYYISIFIFSFLIVSPLAGIIAQMKGLGEQTAIYTLAVFGLLFSMFEVFFASFLTSRNIRMRS